MITHSDGVCGGNGASRLTYWAASATNSGYMLRKQACPPFFLLFPELKRLSISAAQPCYSILGLRQMLWARSDENRSGSHQWAILRWMILIDREGRADGQSQSRITRRSDRMMMHLVQLSRKFERESCKDTCSQPTTNLHLTAKKSVECESIVSGVRGVHRVAN